MSALLREDVSNYWTKHNVTLHHQFSTPEESLEYFHWRNSQYFNYLTCLPVTGQDNKVVLDYGCGPGNDLVGFGLFSKPKKLIGIDVSISSLQEAAHRIQLHKIAAELYHLTNEDSLPLAPESVDYIHSSGVIHHAHSPIEVLSEFKRILKPNGEIKIMVYNYNSIWLHLYVAYVKKIIEQESVNLTIREAFSKSTDGVDCPIANVYKPEEFIQLSNQAGLKCEFIGAAVSMWEMMMLTKRYEAVLNIKFPKEHRDFVNSLTFDKHGFPLYEGHYAGVDGCYRLTK